jgi:hypothetical protein
MSINNLNTYLNVRDAHLRVVSGNVYAQAMNIGGINVETAHGLQSVSNTGNATSLTLEFANVTTGFVTTANAQIGRDLVVTGNATVSTDLTVSANATVTDTLTISEHLIASKEATVTGNLHVTTIRSDSNVVAEYTGPHDRPLRKYPEVALTQNDESATSGYVASTNNKTTGTSGVPYRDAFMAYDGIFSSQNATWQTLVNSYDSNGDDVSGDTFTAGGTNYVGHWNKLQIPNSIKVEKIEIIAYVNGTDDQRPDQGAFLGSTDGTNWELIYSFSSGTLSWSESGDASGIRKITTITDITNTNRYNYLVLVVEKIPSASTATQLGVAELRYYGHEEGSGSLDTTLKTVYNVPATTGTQLEVYYDAKDLTAMPSIVTDLSPNSNGGSVTGATLDTTDGIESFKFITSSSQYIEKVFSGYTQSAEYSASVWFKSDSYTSDSYIFQLGLGDHTNGSGIGMNIESEGPLRAYIYGYGSSSQVSTSVDSIATNNWYHATATYYSSGKTELYVNGILVGEGKATQLGTINASAPLTLGTYYLSSTRQTPSFNGSIANFRLYSKALNADQVKELYDYQKDYFLGSKSQLTIYKGHLGVGVTEPSGQLELAGDERIQAYPPRGMTHPDGTATGTHTTDVTKNITYIEGHGEFKASASLRSRQDTDYDGQQPYNAFDYTTNSYLLYGPGSGEDVGYNKTTGYYEDNEYQLSASSGTPYGHWLQLEMPYKINVKSYFIQHVANDYWPQDWQIWASNDDINWTHIHTYTGGTFDTNPQYYKVSHTGHYKIYTMIITRIKEGSTLDRVRIQELRYFGTPGPTTLDKGSLSLTRSLDVPRISRYDVDTETPRPEKLILDLDTTVNSSPTDISGKGNHGAFYNGASYSAADKAFTFDGTDDYIISQSISGTYTGAFVHSLCVWAKFNTGTGNAVLSLGTFVGSNGTSTIHANGSGTISSVFNGNSVNFTTDMTTNTWYFIVITYDGGSVASSRRAFVNGEEVSQSGTSGTITSLSLSTNPHLYIGGQSNGNQDFNGMISNPKVYSVALEPSEVKKLYNLGRTGRSMVISDTAVGIGKVPEAQLDVRGILKASIGLFPDKPFFVCPVARYGLKAFANPTYIKWYSSPGVLSTYTLTAAERWLLATAPEENVMYGTRNVKLVSILNDTASETSGVQVPYKGKYLLNHLCRNNNTNAGTTFLIYSQKLNEYIIASANNTVIPYGGNTGTSAQYNGVQTVVHLDEGDIVSFMFRYDPNTVGSYEQMVSLVML